MTAGNAPYADRREAVLRAVAGLARLDGQGTQVPPLTAIRGAAILRREAQAILDEQVQAARTAGHSWQEIGEALGYTKAPAEQAYYVLAIARERFPGWVCPACGQVISDAGPGMRPADAESGHADGCTRLAEATAAWEAAREASPGTA